MSYTDFLEKKAQLGSFDGFTPAHLPDFLFDFQAALVEWALRKGRAAIFAARDVAHALACHMVKDGDPTTDNYVAHTLLGKENSSHAADVDTYVAHALRADGFDASEDGTGRGTPIVAIDLQQVTSKVNRSSPKPYSPSLTKSADVTAFSAKDHGADAGEVSPTLRSMGHDASHANGGGQIAIASTMAVRRLTPRECERLQGFPDDYTLVPYRGKPAADGPRYRALGNSMAVNCMRWIGYRIAAVENIA